HLPGVSPACNEIIPGWVLANNLYGVKRNEAKYRARNRARRTVPGWAVFRPEIIELLRDARQRLLAVKQPRDFYTDRDIPGLGKNYLLESARQNAIGTYEFHIHCYALLGLLDRVRSVVR